MSVAARFTEDELQSILTTLKLELKEITSVCRAQTSNLGQLIKITEIEKALADPVTHIGIDTVLQLDTFDAYKKEVIAFMRDDISGISVGLRPLNR